MEALERSADGVIARFFTLMKGVYWGRFNPPHLGHLSLIKKLAKEVDALVVAIGSAESKGTRRNPFSGEERKAMLKEYIEKENLASKVKIVLVPDGESYASSVRNLFSRCNTFDVLYTDKKTVMNLVKNKVKVRTVSRTGGLSSTKVRNAIANGESWEHLTAHPVVQKIRDFDGEERIKGIYARD